MADDIIKCYEMQGIPPEYLQDAVSMDEECYIPFNIHTYHKVNFVMERYRGCLYFHESIDRDNYDDTIRSYIYDLINRIVYGNGTYKFADLQNTYTNSTWDDGMVYDPYIPYEEWWPVPGQNRTKTRKNTKIQIKLNDSLFEL